MRRLNLTLSAEERLTLNEAVRKHPLPHMRERASALIQIAEGRYAKDVAAGGLLQKRCKQTVSSWVHWYNQWGIAGLYNEAGRGRQRSFSPSGPRGS